MPRSAREWWAANAAWHEEQNRAIAAIPYPGIDSVVYERESNNAFWERRRGNAAALIPTSANLSFDTKQIQEFIDAAADAEEAKEDAFLNKFFPDRQGTDKIEQFNILFQSKEQLDKINQRLSAIFSKQSKTNMAPNLSALFGSYFETELNHMIQARISNINANMTPTDMMAQFDKCFNEAAMKASERLTQIVIDKGFGTGEEWQAVHDTLTSNNRTRELFLGALRQAVGVDYKKVSSFFDAIEGQRQAKAAGQRKKINWRTLLAQHFTIAKRTASIGGTVAETALAAVAGALNGMSGSNNGLSYQMHAENVLGNMVKTDSFMLFSEDATIDLTGLAENLNEDLTNSQSLDDARSIMKMYTDEMNKVYGVFVNAKNYTMGAGYHNYTDTKNGSLEELPAFLSDAGISIGNAKDFLAFAYNTGAGAIRSGQRGELEESIVNALKAAAAKIMFDDYQSYGTNNGKGIHMYYLSGKYIPASYIFRGMAQAAGSTTANTDASVTLPNGINDQGGDDGQGWGFGGDDVAFKQALYQHWKKEYNDAQAASSWSVSFTLYIKSILSSTLP